MLLPLRPRPDRTRQPGVRGVPAGGSCRCRVGYDRGVAKTSDDLRQEVLALPAQDRARIASELLASLDSEVVDEDEVDRLWSIETQRRATMLESGEAGTLTWDEIQQRFAGRRAQRTV